MSIFFICGKPRGGKSYQAIRAICLELENKNSKRFIVTNLSLKFDDYELDGKIQMGLQTYCNKYAPHVHDVKERIRILDDDEVCEFWKFEVGYTFEGLKTIKIDASGHTRQVPSFLYDDGTVRGDARAGQVGTLYVLDEVHIYWPARNCLQRDVAHLSYVLSQHGKLKLDIIMVSQHPEQCDKTLRMLAEEYMEVRNLQREPVMGVRAGPFFRVNRMRNPPTSPNPQIFDGSFIYQDFKKYGTLYDTSAGVGIAGSMVPNEQKAGISPLFLLVPIIAFCVIVATSKMWFHKGVSAIRGVQNAAMHSMLKTSMSGGAMAMKGIVPQSSIQSAQSVTQRNQQIPSIPVSAVTEISFPENTNFITGICYFEGKVQSVLTSDGSYIDPYTVHIVRHDVVIFTDGSTMRIAHVPKPESYEKLMQGNNYSPNVQIQSSRPAIQNDSASIPVAGSSGEAIFPRVDVYDMKDSRQFSAPPINGIASQFSSGGLSGGFTSGGNYQQSRLQAIQ